MTVYFLYYAVVVVFGLIWGNKNKKLYVAISLLLLFFLIAFRHPSMGIDLQYGSEEGYLGAYEFFAGKTWKEIVSRTRFPGYDFGFVIFNKLLSYISGNYQTLLIATAALSIIPIFYTIAKESKDSFLSIIIYLGLPSFLMVFSALRQAIAISFLFLTIPFIRGKKFLIQLLIILLAAIIHDTALVFILAYPAYHIKIQPAYRFHTLFFILVLYCFSSYIFPFFLRIESFYKADNNGSNTLFLVYVFIYFLCFTFDREGEFNGLLNLFFITCCIMCFEHLSNVISRLAMYFEMSLILLLPAVFRKYIKEYNLVRIMLICCFMLAGLYFIKTTYWAMSYPYHFMWEAI